MISINVGYECGDICDCDMANKCKYKGNHKTHNISANIHGFFEYKLHIKLPHLFYLSKKCNRLSGTDKCPYGKSRNYTCWDCKNQCDFENCSIPYNERKSNILDKDWGNRCGSFEKCDWADDYKIHM